MLETAYQIKGNTNEAFNTILTDDALSFVFQLHDRFNARRLELLSQRIEKQHNIDNGELPTFLESTAPVRNGDWKVNPVLGDLQDRRVEITGPVDRKMIINALNSGVKVFMADFEDSNSPTWENTINGQINLRDAVNKTISFTNHITGKHYCLNRETATLMVRPRGWHLEEKHLWDGNQSLSASLVDFGLFFFHNAKTLIQKGSGPYFYLPKLESHLEARLWNDVFIFAQDTLGVPQGTIKATVLIETILAAFEMDEILFELKEHSAGLNCGRWDYIFSFIKKFRNHASFTLPDRGQVTMDVHFLKSYVNLLIQTCHKRGAHAMGGMAAQIPIKDNEKANHLAMEKVRQDKEREAKAGHDGTWIAHPGLAPIALNAFDACMPNANQIENERDNVVVSGDDLLAVPSGEITENGFRANIRVGIQYIEAWLQGNGCVPLYNLMEDAATAEISRAQIWQWIQHGSTLSNGEKITFELYENYLAEECEQIQSEVGEKRFNDGLFTQATTLFSKMIQNKEFDEFLTIPAYEYL